jgi:hypothetical protein
MSVIYDHEMQGGWNWSGRTRKYERNIPGAVLIDKVRSAQAASVRHDCTVQAQGGGLRNSTGPVKRDYSSFSHGPDGSKSNDPTGGGNPVASMQGAERTSELYPLVIGVSGRSEGSKITSQVHSKK